MTCLLTPLHQNMAAVDTLSLGPSTFHAEIEPAKLAQLNAEAVRVEALLGRIGPEPPALAFQAVVHLLAGIVVCVYMCLQQASLLTRLQKEHWDFLGKIAEHSANAHRQVPRVIRTLHQWADMPPSDRRDDCPNGWQDLLAEFFTPLECQQRGIPNTVEWAEFAEY